MKNLSLILILISASVSLSATSFYPNTFGTIDDYLLYASNHNAQLAASYEQWQAAAEQVPQAKALPDPKLTYQLETRRSPNSQTFGIMQTFPWFGTIKARTDSAAQQEHAARMRYEAQRLRIFAEIKQNFYEFGYLTQQIEIARQNLELLKHFEEVSRTKYAIQQASHPDHIRAEVEIANSEYELESFQRSVKPVIAKLNALLNRPVDANLNFPAKPEFIPVQFDANQVFSIVSAKNPQIQAAQFDVHAARSQIELAKKRFYPEIDLGLEAMYRSEAIMGPGKDPLFLNVGITLPLWTNSYSAAERQAKANLRRFNQEKIQLENDLLAQAQQAIYGIEINAYKAQLYKNVLIPRAEEMVISYDALYRGGQADFLTLIDAQRTLLRSQLEYQKAIAEYGQNLAQIEFLIGNSL